MSYAVVLKSLRKKNKMTQVVAAKAIDITPAYLSKIENESKVPSMILLQKISKVYKVPLSIINYFASKEEISKLKQPKEFQAINKLIDEMVQYLYFEESYNLKKFTEDFKVVRKLKTDFKQMEKNNLKAYNSMFSNTARASEEEVKYGKSKTRAPKK